MRNSCPRIRKTPSRAVSDVWNAATEKDDTNSAPTRPNSIEFRACIAMHAAATTRKNEDENVILLRYLSSRRKVRYMEEPLLVAAPPSV